MEETEAALLVATVEVSAVVTAIFLLLEGAIIYEWYAVKYRKVPTISNLIEAIPKPLRIAGVVGANAAFLGWQLYHFDIL